MSQKSQLSTHRAPKSKRLKRFRSANKHARIQLSASYRTIHAYSSKDRTRRTARSAKCLSNVELLKGLSVPLDGPLLLEKLRDLVLNERRVILKLDANEADLFMSLLQSNIDDMTADDEHRGAFIDILLELAIGTSITPSCLEITGITDRAEEPITTGGFGDVYRASWNGQSVALKRLREIGGIDKAKLHRNLCKEVLLWRQLRHSNVLVFRGICKDIFMSPAIVSPWMDNGNVTQFAQACDRNIRKQLVYRLLSQVARGLEYLHGQNPVVVHQDVRCANILVNGSSEAVLSDFGLSRLDSNFFNTFTSSLEHGCLRWQAPELLFPDTPPQAEVNSEQTDLEEEDPPTCFPKPTPASDIYALGMTALELITGKKPFSSVVLDAAVVIEIYHDRKPDHGRRVDTEMWKFLLKCWSKTPTNRPSSKEAVTFFLLAEASHEFWHPPGAIYFRRLAQRQDVTVHIPKEIFAAVSGADRCNFNQLEAGYGVKITVPPSDGQSSIEVLVCGLSTSSPFARAEIEKLIELYQRFGDRL